MKNKSTEQLIETLKNLYKGYQITRVQTASDSTMMTEIAMELVVRGYSVKQIQEMTK